MPTPFSRTLRSLDQDSSKYASIAWLIGGLFLATWLLWFFFAKLTVYEISTKARLEVNRSAHPVSALVAGKVISAPLTLGQEVKLGEALITLDATSEKLKLQEEESRLEALPPQIKALEKQIAALEHAKLEGQQGARAAIASAKSRQKEAGSAVAFAKENERRLASLRGSGKISVIESLRAHAETEKLGASRDAITSEIQQLQKESETQTHQRQAEIEELKRDAAKLSGDVVTTEKTVVRLKQEIDKHSISSPVDGQIGELASLQVGTYVGLGDKLGTVVPHSEFRIVAEFSPASVLGRIRHGQLAKMRLDGFPWAQFGTIAATVNRVGSEIRDNKVRVEFTPTQIPISKINLQHGLPGSIEVSVEQTSPAVMVLRVAGQLLSNQEAVKD